MNRTKKKTKKKKTLDINVHLHINFRPTCPATSPSHLLHLINPTCSQKIHSKIHYLISIGFLQGSIRIDQSPQMEDQTHHDG